ncbi:MAG: hypothetical protein ACI8VC_000150 [Candidatus Endobugula sp.]|jgi:hypothetical protein
MKNLFKAIFSSSKDKKNLRNLESLAELQKNDYIKLNDSFALPEELRGKTFQVISIDSYYYGEALHTEWTLKGDVKKKVYLSLSDLGDEDRIVLSYQLKKKEVAAIFGWDQIKAQYQPTHEVNLQCSDTSIYEGWLAPEYYRRECNGIASYFARDCRGQQQPTGGEALHYFEFYNEDDTHSMDIEVWSKDEVDVFISILRPESDIHEFWAHNI